MKTMTDTNPSESGAYTFDPLIVIPLILLVPVVALLFAVPLAILYIPVSMAMRAHKRQLDRQRAELVAISAEMYGLRPMENLSGEELDAAEAELLTHLLKNPNPD